MYPSLDFGWKTSFKLLAEKRRKNPAFRFR